MANVLIVGFERAKAEELRNLIDAIMVKNGWAKPNESATVILDATTRWCDKKEPAPYLVAQHSNADMAKAIGRALSQALNLDTQIEVTLEYIPSDPKKPSAA